MSPLLVVMLTWIVGIPILVISAGMLEASVAMRRRARSPGVPLTLANVIELEPERPGTQGFASDPTAVTSRELSEASDAVVWLRRAGAVQRR